MRISVIAGVAALAMGLALSGCGADTRTIEGTPKAGAPAQTSQARESTPPTSRPKVAPREEDTAGPHDTIASYIQANGIQETPVKRGDPGAPTIDLPFPDGWTDAGADTPEWAYGAMVYTGPEAAEYPPSIVALVSRLDGDVDPQVILELAGGELQNLPGYEGWSDGTFSTLGEFPAFQLGGTWSQDGLTKIVAQKTVVIEGGDGLYVLQLNADGTEEQADIVSAATDVIDAETVITP
ncbi:LpqN/LpqT family lipoprotein [Mycobacterium sp. AMU20-3851]|uniref:LpqN/LpqT family lipoprotein n=1 Tax=Mycobacterium sp. AMU20-3851 TaxID=3122055 RepID=UPI0037551779